MTPYQEWIAKVEQAENANETHAVRSGIRNDAELSDADREKLTSALKQREAALGQRSLEATAVEVSGKVRGDAASAMVPAPEGGKEAWLTQADADRAIEAYEALERVKRAMLQEGRDYVIIQGHPHMKKFGAVKLGAFFGVSTEILEEEREEDKKSGEVVRARYKVRASRGGREAVGIGICERREIQGEKTDHNVVTKAHTRALKRAILDLLGSADPIAEDEE